MATVGEDIMHGIVGDITTGHLITAPGMAHTIVRILHGATLILTGEIRIGMVDMADMVMDITTITPDTGMATMLDSTTDTTVMAITITIMEIVIMAMVIMEMV